MTRNLTELINVQSNIPRRTNLHNLLAATFYVTLKCFNQNSTCTQFFRLHEFRNIGRRRRKGSLGHHVTSETHDEHAHARSLFTVSFILLHGSPVRYNNIQRVVKIRTSLRMRRLVRILAARIEHYFLRLNSNIDPFLSCYQVAIIFEYLSLEL